ncbi:nudix hydrolase homolog [Klebsormidium nitens]|uniref:Nudix hydrolase homolog n=1 Tax=Klebsormidium nitens TaxID=105231 RepID=A0A1Y1IAP3_KLENI|nr:nudix hydrolase homolog [Klebsormidium nitens]|eukprot:GAQ87990.1 nudix hydrolase homolog [Klebsormidium nitens]
MDASPVASTSETHGFQVLGAIEDRYDGMIVEADLLPSTVEEFRSRLEASILHWKAQGKKGIWLKLPLSHVDLVPTAIKAGFGYHHADPGYCMLTLWLPEVPSTLPANASHQVGVGAFLLNDAGEVLAVQEKNGPLRGTGIWKLPTGLANHGEDICAAAVREVKEETGIDAEFQEVLCFRQAHGIAHGKSDLFFVCALRALSHDITPQESEIADAKWLSLKSFREQPFFADRPLFRTMMDICAAQARGDYRGLRLCASGGDLQYQMYVGEVASDTLQDDTDTIKQPQ